MADSVLAWLTTQTSGVLPFITALWPYMIGLIGLGAVAFHLRLKKKFPLNSVIWERRGDDLMTHLNMKIGGSLRTE